MAFVRKRAGKWYARFVDETGVDVERVTTAKTKTEAQRLANEREERAEKVRLGLDVPVIEMTVAEAWKQYRPIVEGSGGFRAMESRMRRHVLNDVAKASGAEEEYRPTRFAKKLCHQVKPADVELLLALKKKEGLSPATVEHIRVELSMLFTFVIESLRAFRGEHPVRQVNKVRIPERPPKYLEAEEVLRALAQVPARWRGFVSTAVYTGLRFSELRRLQRSEVDLGRRFLMVWNTKSGKYRVAPIPDELVPFLRAQLGSSNSEWLFPRPNGQQLTQNCGALRMFKRALVRAGIQKDFAIKDLRSTFATHAAEHSGDLRAVQKALGHQTLAVTETKYAFARDMHFQKQLGGLSFSARPLPAGNAESSQNGQDSADVVPIQHQAKSR